MALIWLVTAVAALFAVAIGVGSRLPKTHIAASRIRLPAPPEDIWAVLTDFGGHAEWRPGLKKVELGPDIDGLPSWYEVCASNLKVHFRVVESKPPRRLVTRLVGDKLPLTGSWVYELTATPEGTELVVTEQDRIFSPFFRFLTRFVVNHHAVMDVFLIALARAFGESVRPEHLNLQQQDPAPSDT
jgi:uncharacterized protein YndB with AHSA1/START domain